MTTHMIHLYYIAANSRMGEERDETCTGLSGRCVLMAENKYIVVLWHVLYFDGTDFISISRNVL
jgi:hypothetical protein